MLVAQSNQSSTHSTSSLINHPQNSKSWYQTMAAIAKTFVATGCSSGLGFELVKQLLAQSQPYKFILGARDTKSVSASFAALNYDTNKHELSVFPLELSDLKGVRTFASQTLGNLGRGKLDCLLLNAGMVKSAEEPEAWGSRWSEQYIVNHLCEDHEFSDCENIEKC
jgi:NAD(P)-dependent dehydrogenase (short-subunit alcohol dehydrogenase family)